MIPTYGRADLLKNAIKSAIRQDYQNLEIVVVDDGSPDNTREVVQGLIAENPEREIKYIYQQNSGVSAARNACVKNSSGDFLAFLDHDDELLSGYVSKLADELGSLGKEYGAASPDWIVEDADGRRSYGFAEDTILNCPGNSWMFRREVFFEKDLWYDSAFGFSEDFELSLRSAGKYKVKRIHMPLFKYRAGLPSFKIKQKTLTNDYRSNYLALTKAIQKNAAYVEKLDADSRAEIEFHVGVFAAAAGEMPAARKHFANSLKLRFSATKAAYYLATCGGRYGFAVFRVAISRLKRWWVVWRSREKIYALTLVSR